MRFSGYFFASKSNKSEKKSSIIERYERQPSTSNLVNTLFNKIARTEISKRIIKCMILGFNLNELDG